MWGAYKPAGKRAWRRIGVGHGESGERGRGEVLAESRWGMYVELDWWNIRIPYPTPFHPPFWSKVITHY